MKAQRDAAAELQKQLADKEAKEWAEMQSDGEPIRDEDGNWVSVRRYTEKDMKNIDEHEKLSEDE